MYRDTTENIEVIQRFNDQKYVCYEAINYDIETKKTNEACAIVLESFRLEMESDCI